MNRLNENSLVFHEQIAISSAASGLTHGYSMEDCDKITFICGLGTAAAAAAAGPVFSAVQSADVGLSTNAAIAGATALCGPSTANQVTNARQVLISVTTAATGGETLTLNGFTLTGATQSTLVSTVTTALTFGSSLATSAGGLEAIMNTLSSVINNSTLSFFVTASTPSTLAVRLTAKDTASTGITLVSTGGVYTITSEKAHSVVEILAGDLNSTSKYVGISIATVATAAVVGVTVIKQGLRHAKVYESAQNYKKST